MKFRSLKEKLKVALCYFFAVLSLLTLLCCSCYAASSTKTVKRKQPAALKPSAETVITVNQQGTMPKSQSSSSGNTNKETEMPPAILSIIPAQGEPGTNVILSGPGFNETTTAWLGTNEIKTILLGTEQIGFEIPTLYQGVYALFVKNASGITSKTYTFNVLPKKPVITTISPETLPACAEMRDITVSGKNFSEGASVLLDSAVIRSRYSSTESMTVSIPSISGGLHHLQVKNSDDTLSSAMALVIESKPEIISVTTGSQDVNFYELLIRGNNFQQGSTVVADGRRIGTGSANPGDRDKVLYLDCQQMIYQRYPFSSTAKEIRIQVINPTGEQSSPFTLLTP